MTVASCKYFGTALDMGVCLLENECESHQKRRQKRKTEVQPLFLRSVTPPPLANPEVEKKRNALHVSKKRPYTPRIHSARVHTPRTDGSYGDFLLGKPEVAGFHSARGDRPSSSRAAEHHTGSGPSMPLPRPRTAGATSSNTHRRLVGSSRATQPESEGAARPQSAYTPMRLSGSPTPTSPNAFPVRPTDRRPRQVHSARRDRASAPSTEYSIHHPITPHNPSMWNNDRDIMPQTSVIRRYFFPGTVHTRGPFMQHYDVLLRHNEYSAERSGKPCNMDRQTLYYLDMIESVGNSGVTDPLPLEGSLVRLRESLKDSQGEIPDLLPKELPNQIDAMELVHWVSSVKPRSTEDYPPMFSLCQNLLISILNNYIRLSVEKDKKLREVCDEAVTSDIEPTIVELPCQDCPSKEKTIAALQSEIQLLKSRQGLTPPQAKRLRNQLENAKVALEANQKLSQEQHRRLNDQLTELKEEMARQNDRWRKHLKSQAKQEAEFMTEHRRNEEMMFIQWRMSTRLVTLQSQLQQAHEELRIQSQELRNCQIQLAKHQDDGGGKDGNHQRRRPQHWKGPRHQQIAAAVAAEAAESGEGGEAPSTGSLRNLAATLRSTNLEAFVGDVDLNPSSGEVVMDAEMTKEELFERIGEIYRRKLKADAIDDRNGSRRESMAAFLTLYFLTEFSLKAVASDHLMRFIAAVKKHQSLLWVEMMGRFIGVLQPAWPLSVLNTFLHLMSSAELLFMDKDGGSDLSRRRQASMEFWKHVQNLHEVTVWLTDAEVSQLTHHVLDGTPHEKLLQSFLRHIDTRDGVMSLTKTPNGYKLHLVELLNELVNELDEHTQSMYAKMFRDYDENEDGLMTCDEFVKLLRKVNKEMNQKKAMKSYVKACCSYGTAGVLLPSALSRFIRELGLDYSYLHGSTRRRK
eukprot:Rmarinus@m.1494